MKRKKALILINNTAGHAQGHSDTFSIVKDFAEAGYEPLVFPIIPGSKLTSEELVKDYGASSDIIMCAGGDGTLNHTMNSIMSLGADKRPPLAYVPSGSTNDFARCLGVPDTRKEAINVAVSGKPFKYDVGKMNDKYFNYVAAFGAFSEISYDTDQTLKNVLGYAAYVLNAIMNLPKNLGYGVKMEINTAEGSYKGEYVFGGVCNSVSVGGMKLFDNADVQLDDGSMELLLIRSPKNLSDFNSVISALATGDVNNPNISIHPVKEATFSSKESVSWTLDGEFGGSSKDTEIKVLKQAMTIIRE